VVREECLLTIKKRPKVGKRNALCTAQECGTGVLHPVRICPKSGPMMDAYYCISNKPLARRRIKKLYIL
jgi:hypothetical protein